MRSFNLVRRYLICVLVVLSCVICGVCFLSHNHEGRIVRAEVSSEHIIRSAAEFVEFAKGSVQENKFYAGQKIYLANDIDMSGYALADYKVSKFGGAFYGSYGGKHYKIYNINMNGEFAGKNNGLFVNLQDGGVIENLSIEANFDFSQSEIGAEAKFAPLCGKLSGKINNCYIKCTISGSNENSVFLNDVASNITTKGTFENVYAEFSSDVDGDLENYLTSAIACSDVSTSKLVLNGAVIKDVAIDGDNEFWTESENEPGQLVLKIMLPNSTGESSSSGETDAGTSDPSAGDGSTGESGSEEEGGTDSGETESGGASSGESGSGESGGSDESSGSGETGGSASGGESGEIVTPEPAKTKITPKLGQNEFIFNKKAPILDVIFDGTENKVEYDIEISPSCTGDVGEYTATIKLRDTQSYELIVETVKFEIVPYTIEIMWGKIALNYNAKEQVPTFTFAKVSFAPDLEIEYKSKFVNAGKHIAELIAPLNFALKNATQNFEIAPYDVYINWTNTSLAYNGKQQMPTPSFAQNDITQNLVLERGGFETKVGSNSYVGFVKTDDTNFNLKNATCPFAIVPADVTVRWNSVQSFEYNSKIQMREFDLELPAGAAADDFEVKCNHTPITPGKYLLEICAKEPQNYKIINKEGWFEITKYQIFVIWDEMRTFEYDGQQHYPQFYATNLPAFCEDVSVDILKIGVDVGKYDAHLYANNEYMEIDNPVCPYEITPRKLSLTWENLRLVYNATLQAPTAVCAAEWADKVKISISGAQTNQGKYPASAIISGKNAKNFEIINPQVEYTILPYEFEVVWDTSEIVYDDNFHAPKILNDLPSFAFGLSLKYSNVYTAVGKNYSTSVSFTNDPLGNFTIKNPQCNFDIVPAAVAVEWGETDFVYNGQDQFPRFSLDKLFATSFELDGWQQNAGTYLATVTSTSDNYYFVNNKTKFTIKPYQVSVTWSDSVLKYNTYPQKPTAMYTKTVFCDNLDIAVSGAQKDVGEYVATASLSNNDFGNFELLNASTEFTISQKEVKINWQKIEAIFAGTPLSPEFSCSEICSDLVINCPSFVDAGNYNVTVTTENQNYILTNATTQFTIFPLPIFVEWGSAEFVYDDEFHCPTAECAKTELQISGAQKNFGEYEATAISADKNYVVQNATQKFVIKKFEIDVVWAANEFVYSGEPQAPRADYAIPEFATAQDFVISGAKINAGSGYFAEITCKNNNIVMKNDKKSFCIQPYKVLLTWSAENFVYNGGEQSPQCSFESNVLTENLTLIKSGAGKNAGTHRISVTTADTNFKIQNATFDYSIAPCEVAVVWQNGDFVYNNTVQKPTFAVFAPIFATDLEIIQPIGAKNAGSHTAVVVIDPDCNDAQNFVLTNATCDFVIRPCPLEIAWTNIDACYSGEPHIPTASYATVIDFDTLPRISVTGAAVDEGTYTATAIIANPNFVLENAECEFCIFPQAVEYECEQATVQISATNEEVVGKIDIVELSTEEFIVPSGQKFLFGFEIVEIVQVPTPMAKTFAVAKDFATKSTGETAYFVKLYLARDFEMPEDASLYMLTEDNYYRLDYQFDGNAITFTTHDVGKIYLATSAENEIFLPLTIGFGALTLILVIILVVLIKHARSKSAKLSQTQTNSQHSSNTQTTTPKALKKSTKLGSASKHPADVVVSKQSNIEATPKQSTSQSKFKRKSQN